MNWITDIYVNHPIWVVGLLVLPVMLGLGMLGFLFTVHGFEGSAISEVRNQIIEAANYATQTVTTVGYGNMDLSTGSNVSTIDKRADKRLKLFSSFYTIVSFLVWSAMAGRAFAVH